MGNHTYAKAGSYPFTVTITDDFVTAATTVSSTATVSPAVLTANPGPSISGTEGKSTGTEILAVFTSTNLSAVSGNFYGVITWGDGTTSNFTAANIVPQTPSSPTVTQFAVVGSHTYADKGTYPLTVEIEDKLGAAAVTTTAQDVTVNDAELTANLTPVTLTATGKNAPAVGPIYEGNSTGTLVVARFTDVDPGGKASDYTATINWGDGVTTSAPGTVTLLSGTTFTVSGSYTYADEGSYPVTVTITDTELDGSGSVANVPNSTVTVQSTTVKVADAPLTASAAAR